MSTKPTEEDLELIEKNLTMLFQHHYGTMNKMLTNLKIVREVRACADGGEVLDQAFESARKRLLFMNIDLSTDAIRVRYYRMLKKNSQ